MSIYSKDASINGGDLTQTEIHLYGSSRLGIYNVTKNVQNLATNPTGIITFTRGKKFFELTNHLGNVLVTVSDKKTGVDTNGDGIDDYYTADVVSANDYYPFGMGMPGRKYKNVSQSEVEGYRYGFNGQEKSTEINSSENLYTAEFSEYDSRIGRRWNIDPKQIAELSGFSVLKNNPLFYKDILGDTTYRFDKEGKYSGKGDLDKKGTLGSIGEYENFKNSKGNEFKSWASSKTFSFNDPDVDSRQLIGLKEGDKVLQIVEEGNINDIMNQAGIKPMNIYSRWKYANKQSSGGKMDFGVMYLNGQPGGGNSDLVGGFFIFGSENKAYNAMDAGNWLWGQAMQRLGFNYSTAKFASEANEMFKDSEGDQRAIRFGYHYSTKIKTAIPFKLTIGISNVTTK